MTSSIKIIFEASPMFVEAKRKTVPLENFSSEPIRKSAATQRTLAAYHSSGKLLYLLERLKNHLQTWKRCEKSSGKRRPQSKCPNLPITEQKQELQRRPKIGWESSQLNHQTCALELNYSGSKQNCIYLIARSEIRLSELARFTKARIGHAQLYRSGARYRKIHLPSQNRARSEGSKVHFLALSVIFAYCSFAF